MDTENLLGPWGKPAVTAPLRSLRHGGLGRGVALCWVPWALGPSTCPPLPHDPAAQLARERRARGQRL